MHVRHTWNSHAPLTTHNHGGTDPKMSKKDRYRRHLEHLNAVQYRAAFAARAGRYKLGLPIPSRGTAIKGLTTAALLGTYAYVVRARPWRCCPIRTRPHARHPTPS